MHVHVCACEHVVCQSVCHHCLLLCPQVVATDGGTPMRNGTATVTVCVSDINDNAPMFNDRTLALSIPEDFRVRDELSRVSTTDGDNIGVSTAFQCPSEGINSSVVYSLVFEVRRSGRWGLLCYRSSCILVYKGGG